MIVNEEIALEIKSIAGETNDGMFIVLRQGEFALDTSQCVDFDADFGFDELYIIDILKCSESPDAPVYSFADIANVKQENYEFVRGEYFSTKSEMDARIIELMNELNHY